MLAGYLLVIVASMITPSASPHLKPTAPVSMSALFASSDVVVAGRVVEDLSVAGVRDARSMEVEQSFKGDGEKVLVVSRRVHAGVPSLELQVGERCIVFAKRLKSAPGLHVIDRTCGVLRGGAWEENVSLMRDLGVAVGAFDEGQIDPLVDWTMRAIENPTTRHGAVRELRVVGKRSKQQRRIRDAIVSAYGDRLLRAFDAMDGVEDKLVVAQSLVDTPGAGRRVLPWLLVELSSANGVTAYDMMDCSAKLLKDGELRNVARKYKQSYSERLLVDSFTKRMEALLNAG